MPLISKRNKANEEFVQNDAMVPTEAIAALRKFKGPKFDQSMNICLHLGIDTKHADQALRGSVSLPNGTGKSQRVVVVSWSRASAVPPLMPIAGYHLPLAIPRRERASLTRDMAIWRSLLPSSVRWISDVRIGSSKTVHHSVMSVGSGRYAGSSTPPNASVMIDPSTAGGS